MRVKHTNNLNNKPKPEDPKPQSPLWNDIRELTHQNRVKIGFQDKQAWKNAPAVFDEHTLKIFNHPVMEDWETPYMERLAKIATSKNGVVLELGFGMGISAGFIQKANIKKHIIIEANHQIAQKGREFMKRAPHPVEILEGLWEETIDKIPDNSIDGILFDTYPLSELEIHKNHFSFFPFAFKKLKPGGIFTYYSDEMRSFHPVHLQKLLETGFKKENINGEVVSIKPPKDCQYWKSNTILAPIVVK